MMGLTLRSNPQSSQQKTSEFCRCCCCQPNIHWRVHPYNENWQVGQEGPTLMSISEDASKCGRTCSFCMPGYRATKYTVRAGEYDEKNPGTRSNRVLYTHEKDETCGTNVFIAFTDGGQLRIPMCCNLPYLETKDANGAKLGRTQYICDACLFVPKYHISNRHGEKKYLLRPDTCVAGESSYSCCWCCRSHLPTLPASFQTLASTNGSAHVKLSLRIWRSFVMRLAEQMQDHQFRKFKRTSL